MARFLSKPFEISAVQLTRELVETALFEGKDLPAGVTFKGEISPGERRFFGTFICLSAQGEVTAELDDWIIAEPHHPGLSYPCKPDVFAAKYTPAE